MTWGRSGPEKRVTFKVRGPETSQLTQPQHGAEGSPPFPVTWGRTGLHLTGDPFLGIKLGHARG